MTQERNEKIKKAIASVDLSQGEKESALFFHLNKMKNDENRVFGDLNEARSFIADNYTNDFNVFRGQTRDWPIISSYWRKSDNERKVSADKTVEFMEWLLNNPVLKDYHSPQHKLMGIAQHHSYEHSLSTYFLDFSYSLDVASFFATDGMVNDGDIGMITIANIPTMKMQYAYMGVEGCHLFDIDGLWRFENQKGLFLVDINGDFEKFAPLIKVKFKQSSNLTFSTKSVNKRTIYPEKNALEREIDRYFNISLRSRPLDELFSNTDNLSVFKVEKDPISVEAESIVRYFNWDEEDTCLWKEFKAKKYGDIITSENSSMVVTIEIDSESFFPSVEEEQQINSLLSLLKDNETTPYIPRIELKATIPDLLNLSTVKASKLFSAYLTEYCISYISLPFDEKSKAITLKILALFAIYESDEMPDIVGGHEGTQTFCRTFQTGEVVYCDIEDYQGVVSASYLSCDILDNFEKLSNARFEFNEHFKGRYDFYDIESGKQKATRLDSNRQVFQFVTNAKQLFMFFDLINVWIFFVIPWQIAFRSNKHVIVNPVFVEKFGLA